MIQSEPSTTRNYCDACERQLNTTDAFGAHMKEKIHRRLMEITSYRNMQDRIACDNAHPSKMIILEYPPRVEPTPTAEPTPGASKYDPFNLPSQKLEPVVAIDSFHCVPCSHTCKLIDFEEHRTNISHHTEMLGLTPMDHISTPWLTALHSRGKTWYCATCMADFHVDSKEAHLAGKQHTRTPVHSAPRTMCLLPARRTLTVRSFGGEQASTVRSDETTDLADYSVKPPVLVKDVARET